MKIRTILALAGVAGMCSVATAQKSTAGEVLPGYNGNASHEPSGGIVPADFLVIETDGVESWDGFGDPDNVVMNFDLAPNAHVIGLSWDVELEAFDPSWISEISVNLSDTDNTTGVSLSPGAADSAPGHGFYADSADLVDLGLDFNVGADGVLRAEFYEGFDDADNVLDGMWHSGNITVEWVPTPGSLALLGLGGLAAVRRRR